MNAIGYCIGGTLLAATLAYMAAQGDERIKSATFFATQVDFSEPGDLQVFIDEQQLANLDKMMEEKGYLEGQAMFTTFNMLRANDLFWSFYVNNYLLGQGSRAVRSALLERRRHPHAAQDPHVLPARDVPEEQPGEAGRASSLPACRST